MKEEKRRVDRKFRRIGTLLIFALVLWLGKTYTGQAMMIKKLEAEKKVEEKKIIALKRDIRNLEDEMDKKDSLEFIEKVAREDYRMVKPREIIYIDKNKKDNKKSFIKPINK